MAQSSKIERLEEIFNIAVKLGWVIPYNFQVGATIITTPMCLSGAKECMLAMVDDVELERMRDLYRRSHGHGDKDG